MWAAATRVRVVRNSLQISLEPEDSSEAPARIVELLEQTIADVGFPRAAKQFCATLRGPDGTIEGGITAKCFWGWLYIVALVVSPSCRGGGYGRQLLLAAESWGIEAGSHSAYLMTMSFQAREFYERAGYEVFAKLENFPEEHSRLFMRKTLTET